MEEDLNTLLDKLVRQSSENEYLEFKKNFHSEKEIGQDISALSNSACLRGQNNAYLIFGVEDTTHKIVGTTFKPFTQKVKKEDLIHWVSQRLNPKIDFDVKEFEYKPSIKIVLFIIPAARNQPVSFLNERFIRVASITRKLNEFPLKEESIWKREAKIPFEKEQAAVVSSQSDIIRLLDTQQFFELLKLPYPPNQNEVINNLLQEKIIKKEKSKFIITNLGALLFAKNLSDFESLEKKAARVIVYEGKNKLKTISDISGSKGYAIGFVRLVEYINDKLPHSELTNKVLRDENRMYPKEAIRELVANALVHQEFSGRGNGPTIEIFSDRIEFINDGLPLITVDRFIDENSSRNEILISLMRRLGVCEEKGSGIDRVIHLAEVYQLPAPNISTLEQHTKVVMYSTQKYNNMDKADKIRACYQHCVLKYVSNEKMTNQSLRERFNIEEHNYSIASRIIRDTIEAHLIKDSEPENRSRKYAKYIPYWA
jgi:predicted HTH transcriptional regulator